MAGASSELRAYQFVGSRQTKADRRKFSHPRQYVTLILLPYRSCGAHSSSYSEHVHGRMKVNSQVESPHHALQILHMHGQRASSSRTSRDQKSSRL
ncbi:hypothetical protein MPTK1_3g18770 [Marchantia polymorpha subsp. ruderalis]|uniref:Uncharacterized protein n=1 Tax=Marchantia polymorpha subsp. ruderalis TaxID=1480154 RepID=A0AAF6B2B3_MARPO|nr:hypothetical protein Mp_3g18770 [Marchantia polymorpha subsp. ruderalis]